MAFLNAPDASLPKPGRSRPRSLRAGLGVAALLATAAVPAAAQSPFDKLADLGPPVADEELGDVRGKFIQADKVSFFGISMVTSWQDRNGITTTAQLVFDVSFLRNGSGGDPQASLMVGWIREGDPAMDVSDSHTSYTPVIVAQDVLPAGGLDTTQGAAQANIVTGTNNATVNGLQIALVPTSSLPHVDKSGLNPLTQSSDQTFADGDILQFRVKTNELSMALTGNNGSDSTLQSVGGDFGRILQQTMLGSDGNAVSNTAAIVIGTDIGANNFNAVRATEALSVMRGRGF
jgi:hypothetical protein